MTLQEIAGHLISVGFTAITKTRFQKQSMDVEIKDAMLAMKHPEMLMLPPPFLRVKIYGAGNERYAQFDCSLESFRVFENTGL